MSEAREFPGWPKPSKVLVRRVRSVLWQYLCARPQQLDESWRLAWEWARCITLKSDYSARHGCGGQVPTRSPLSICC
jgi:hypothetical protein